MEALSYQHEGSGDLGNLIKNPIDAITARQAASEATTSAEKEYDHDRKSLANGEGDAFRHALWTYKMSKTLGPNAAKIFGDGHERTNAPEGERLMDLYNNAIGRELAADPRNKDRPDEEVIREAIRAGRLQLQPFNLPQQLPVKPDYPSQR